MSFLCAELLLFNYAKVKTVFHSMAPLSTVCFHSIQLARLFEEHWAECGIVCFLVNTIFKSD